MSEERLFVYGSLKRGGRLHSHLARLRGVTLLSEGSIRARLVDCGSYPGAVESESAHDLVWGELYRLPYPGQALAALDRLEGYRHRAPKTSLFIRERTRVLLPDGSSTEAWFYRLNALRCTGRRG